MKIFLTIYFLLSFIKISYALPKQVEIWFMSSTLTTYYKSLYPQKIVAFNSDDNCIPMGEGCFNPQLGFIEQKNALYFPPEKDNKLPLKTFNALDVNLVNCDKNNYFDIYCGKNNNSDYVSKFEIWIDISASLRSVDYSKESDQCSRRKFVEQVLNKCPKDSINISLFNTSIKQLGSHKNICNSYGANNLDRLIKWIRNSNIKNLIIITDIDEYSIKFDNFIKEVGAEIKGVDSHYINAKNLIKKVDEVVRACKKFQ